MNRDYEELEKLIEDGKLKDEVALHLVNFWKYLNIGKYCQKDAAIKLFINGEKGKIDFVDEIETELFQLEGKQILDVGCGKGGSHYFLCATRCEGFWIRYR